MASGSFAVRGRHRNFAACSMHLPSASQGGRNVECRSFTPEPRSAYLLRGPSRTDWEHSIPPLEELRYLPTLRTLSESP